MEREGSEVTYSEFRKHVVDEIVGPAFGRMVLAGCGVHVGLAGDCSHVLLQRLDQQRARHDVLKPACEVGGVR